MTDTSVKPRSNRRTLLLLSALVIGMFGFGFAMVPLYNLICQVTGVQSVELRQKNLTKQTQIAQSPADNTAKDRFVTVKFDATVNPSLAWDFSPMQRKIRVQPGKTYEVSFLAKNRTSKTVVGQAIPSVIPWQATAFFNKMECFCFSRQALEGGQVTEMPLIFSVSPDLPAGINSLTLSYSFMRMEDGSNQASVSELSPESRISSKN